MRQGMHCHACGDDFSVDMDMQADGNHVFRCPQCRHEHCRVVKNGEITEEGWAQRNNYNYQTYYPRVYTSNSATSTYASTSGDWYTSSAWANTSTSTASW